MSVYRLNRKAWGTHNLARNLLGEGKVVLDLGCNKGHLSDISPLNIYYGVDANKDDLSVARTKYKRVYDLDLNKYQDFHENLKFDTLVFLDILEHLVSPEAVLGFFVDNYLKDGGEVILSLPNIAHITTRINLLLGNFTYTESGILDRSHLHLYTEKTAKELIKNAGLEIEKVVFSSNTFGKLIDWFPYCGSILGFNLIFKCKKY